MENLYQNLGTYIPDNLMAGNEVPVLTAGITLTSGQGVLKRGTVIGIVTETGKGMKVDKAAVDGSKVAYGILTDDVDATAEVTTTVYISGLFNSKALIFGGASTVADHENELRQLGIFLRNVL